MTTEEFTGLVTKYSYSLRPFALSLTRNSEEAKDLLQETIYRALLSMDRYADGTNLKAWLYTIMKNIFINNYRRKLKKNTIFNSSEYQNNVSSSAWVKNSGEAKILLQDITLAIENLTDEYRTPFMMHYQGFKYNEIADHLTLPIGTVKSRIHFARKTLKGKLKGMG
jgi:RNA polymerase sigma factor (sigma-70 family)